MVPAVPTTERDRFEARCVRPVLKAHRLRHPSAQATLTRQDLHVPVAYAAPAAVNTAILGLDLASEPLRHAALDRAAATRLPSAACPRSLVQADGNTSGLLAAHPLFEAQTRHLRGYAVGVLNAPFTLRHCLAIDRSAGRMLTLRLFDATGGSPHLLATNTDPDAESEARITGSDTLAPLFLFDRTWIVATHPGPDFLAAHPRRAAATTAATGLLLTVAFTVLTTTVTRRRERLEAEVRARTAELRESENRYRSLFANNSATMLLVDPRNDAIVEANPAALAFYGWPATELVGKRLSAITILPSQRADESNIALLHDGRQHYTFRQRRAMAPSEMSKCTARHRTPRPSLIWTIVHDITDRVAAESAVARSETNFRNFFDHPAISSPSRLRRPYPRNETARCSPDSAMPPFAARPHFLALHPPTIAPSRNGSFAKPSQAVSKPARCPSSTQPDTSSPSKPVLSAATGTASSPSSASPGMSHSSSSPRRNSRRLST
jgi:PAS domain S-box-containing protein